MKNRGYLLMLMLACLMGACKTNDEKACATRADELNAREQALNQREEQLNAREKQMAGNNTNYTADTGSMNTNGNAGANAATKAGSNAAGNMAGKEPSLYRRNRTRSGYAHSNTPGQFPEGSDRLLADKDLEYLSPWGIKVITNEIYARHGMRFTDPELKRHFDEEKWYHARTSNVNGALTKTERQNLNFISNFKAQEE
jgi:hypothetical protein